MSTKQLTISEETYNKIKDQLKDQEVEALNASSWEDFIGKKIFMRSVTYHCVGRVKRMFGDVIELEDASWVADSGRFMGAIKDGNLDEIEPVGQMWVNKGAMIDMFPWNHSLPSQQK